MWFININMISTIHIVTNLIGFFYQSDYRTNFLFQSNINVKESRDTAKSFEFTHESMKAARSIANNQFPDEFFFGAGSSAYQIEGAYHSPGNICSLFSFNR